MSQLVCLGKAKSRRKKSKRKIRINSKGFKVLKGKCVVYIGDNVRPELVDAVRDLYNDPSFNTTRKHIKYISIQYQKTNKFVGFWDDEKAKLTIIDDHRQTIQEFKSTLCHEIKGHTRWHLALKWRREELIAFNKLANKCDPITTYVKDNEETWRKMNDDQELKLKLEKKYEGFGMDDFPHDQYNKDVLELEQTLKSNGHELMTRYANEQHSAIAEIVCGYGGHKVLINDKDKNELIKLYEALHY